MSFGRSDWIEQARFMREQGADVATWSPDGALLHLTLGSAPATDVPQQETQTSTPEQRDVTDRQERRRVATAASGRPVLRVEPRE